MTESYKVAVAIALSSNATQIFGALGAHFLKLDKHLMDFHNNWKKTALLVGGGLALGALTAEFEIAKKLVEKTKDYSSELVRLKNLGGDMMTAVNDGSIEKQAFDISQRIPINVKDLMKIPGATNSLLGTEESKQHWESFARTAFVLQSQKDYKGDVGADLQALIKAGDLMGRITDPATGKIDDKRLESFLDTSVKAIGATHGMVSPQVMLGLAKQGGFTSRGLSEDGFLTQIMMAQMMGGPRAGTALTSMWQQMAGGQMMSRSAKGLEDVGMLKSDEWENDHGHVILSDAASHRLTKMIGKDPLEFTANIVKNLKERGILDPEEQMRMVMRALGRQTTQRYTAEQVANFQQMLAERERIKQGLGGEDAFKNIMNEDVEANMKAVSSAWDNLLYAIAGPNSKNVIEILQKLTGGLNSLQQSIRGMNPETLISIGKGLGYLALILGVGGTGALLLALGPAGWLIGGLAALAVALSDPRFREWLKQDNAMLAALAGWFDKAWQGISAWLASHSIADMIVSWLGQMLDRVKGFFGSAPSQVFPGGTMRPQNQRFEGSSDDPRLVHARFDPGTGGPKHQQFAFALNIDGDKLAQTVIDKFESKYGFSTGAPSSDGYARYAGVDHQLAGV